MSKRGIVLGLVVALAVAAVAVVGVGPGIYDRLRADEVEPLSADIVMTKTVAGQTAFVAADDATEPRSLMLFMHDRGADHEALTSPRLREFAQDLVDRGWIVAAYDAHLDDWGSEVSQDDYAAFHEYLLAEFMVDRTVVVSEGMGAIAGLNLLVDRRFDGTVDWVGVSPVLDVAAALEDEELAAMIDADTSAEAVAEHDPRLIPPSALRRLDLAVAVAFDDELVAPSTGTEWAIAHRAALVTCTGGHAAAGCYDDLLSLITR